MAGSSLNKRKNDIPNTASKAEIVGRPTNATPHLSINENSISEIEAAEGEEYN